MIVEEVQEKWICGFWRRIGALLIDSLILGVFGYILGLFFGGFFTQLWPWGVLVGFVISITYFGFMNSCLCNGQTLGKIILSIKVVNGLNETISLPKSILRYSFLAIPFTLNGIHIQENSFLAYPISIIYFGGSFSIFYLYIFNRVSRQSLHDIVVGTYVINSKEQKQNLGEVWRPHYVIVFSIFILSAFLPLLGSSLAESVPFEELKATQKQLHNNDFVRFASVLEGATIVNSSDKGTSTTTYIRTQAFLNENEIENIALAKTLAETIIRTYQDSKTKDVIKVTLTYGYDIGIWSQWHNYSHVFNPSEVNGFYEE